MQIVWSIPKHPRLLIFNWYYCVETRRLTVAKIQSAISKTFARCPKSTDLITFDLSKILVLGHWHKP